MFYPREFLDELKTKVDILDLAKLYGIHVIKSGGIYQAKCIHPGDDTPSLTFYPKTNSFHCFGCGASGDTINFVAFIHDIEFDEAVQKLADHAGISLSMFSSGQSKVFSRQYDSMISYNRTYWKELQDNKEAIDYLLSRFITEKDIGDWRIGLVPERYNKPYTGRIAFAIMDEQGRTAGFGYRSVDGSKPKYINSPDSLIFKKSSLLYGLHNIKKLIRDKDYVILVEGYTDVIQLQKYNEPAAGLMGTALSQEQVELIKKHTNNAILFLDGDAAGALSTNRIAQILKDNGIQVMAIITDKDPDILAIELKDNISDYIKENAVLIPGFNINRLLSDVQTKLDAVILSSLRQALPLLAQMPDAVELEHYVSRVSLVLGINKNEIYNMLTKGGYYGNKGRS